MGWLEDTFTDTDLTALQNHTPDVGTGSWVKFEGTDLVIDTNQLHEPNDSFKRYYFDQVSPSGDDELVIDIPSVDQASYWIITLYLRFDHSAETGYSFNYDRAESHWRIKRHDGPSDATEIAVTEFTNTAGVPGSMKVVANGNTLEFYEDSTLRIDHDISGDGTQYTAAGEVGIRCKATWLDNLVVTDLSAGAATPTIDTAPDVLVRTGTGYSITGSNFGATQGTGALTLETSDGSTTVVSQTVQSWSANQIDFDVAPGGHSIGATTLQLEVTTDDGDTVAHTGVTLRHPEVNYVIKDDADTAKASETGVSWWVSESRGSAPVDSGTSGTTDGSGNSTNSLPNATAAPGTTVVVETKLSGGSYGEGEVTVS